MSFKFDGMRELEKEFKEMERRSRNVFGHVELTDLFTNSFMEKHTSFSSFEQFLEAGNFIVNCQEDFDSIDADEMDKHVAATTQFESWEDMLGVVSEPLVNKVLFG